MSGGRKSSRKHCLWPGGLSGLLWSFALLSSAISAYQPGYFDLPEIPLVPPRIPSTDSPDFSGAHEFVSVVCSFYYGWYLLTVSGRRFAIFSTEVPTSILLFTAGSMSNQTLVSGFLQKMASMGGSPLRLITLHCLLRLTRL